MKVVNDGYSNKGLKYLNKPPTGPSVAAARQTIANHVAPIFDADQKTDELSVIRLIWQPLKAFFFFLRVVAGGEKFAIAF